MKTTEIVGFKRTDLGSSASKRLRAEGNAPCVVYGGNEEPIHFYAPMYLFKDLLYTPDAYIVKVNVEGKELKAVMKDVTFHPVSETITHVDFLRINDSKAITVELPIKIVGTSPGVANGGKLFQKINKLKVKGLSKDLPEFIEVSINDLGLGKSVRVKNVPASNYELLNNPNVTIASVIIPRALKAAGIKAEK